MALIAPSLLTADFARLGEALEWIRSAGASMVHVDVMDGHFTPEISAGRPVVASLRKATDLALDVHLLMERPERFAVQFVDAGAERLAVHYEATPHLGGVLSRIRAKGVQAGVAINPATPTEFLSEVLGEIDFLTILAAEPGLKERRFLPKSVEKVRQAGRLRQALGVDFALQVEGGIGLENLEELVSAGADILVVGSAIFHNENPAAKLAELIRLAAQAQRTSIA